MNYSHIFLQLMICSFFSTAGVSQSNWNLIRNEDWIQVYEANMNHSEFKQVKVVCTIEGTYDKLLKVVNNVGNLKNWIYNTKSATMLRKASENEYYYYTETFLPWPLQNRDAAVHIKWYRDSLNRFLKIEGVGVPDYVPVAKGKIRVPRSANTWLVTMTGLNKLHIVYVFEADPGGSLPSWLVNALVNKGPYESFKKLAEQLKK